MSRTSARARACGVPYLANNWRDAISVISSRVLWERIVPMSTLNGSSVSAVIFARAVLAPTVASSPRYLRPRPERTSSTLRALEMRKGLPRRVDGTRDDDETGRPRKGDGPVHRLGDLRDDGGAGHVGRERAGDRLRRIGAGRLRLRDDEVGGEGAEGVRERAEVLVVEDAEDEDCLLSGEQLPQGRGEGRHPGRVVSAVDDDRGIRPHDLHPTGPRGLPEPRHDGLLRDPEPHLREVADGREGDRRILRLVRAEEGDPELGRL